MVFVKHNSLKSDKFFNPIFIPGFLGSKFSGSRFLRIRVQGPEFGSRVQGPGPGFRSSQDMDLYLERLNSLKFT